LVHGRRALVCSHSQVTTPSAPNDAFFNFGIRVQLDGDQHGEMGRTMVALLCDGRPERIAEAQAAAARALTSRLRLWDEVAAALSPATQSN
jgi:hypothetical protein